MSSDLIKQGITDQLGALKFDAVGFVNPDSIDQAPKALREFLSEGRHGTMEWMAEREVWRSDPQKLWPDVKTIIVAGMNYGPDIDPLDLLSHRDRGNISVYARGRDYHDVLKKRLKRVAGWIHREHDADVKVFVDTAPVMEKPLAEAAGLGWQGKHTNLVSKDFGSWLFLGSIFTTLDLSPESREIDHCGSCSSCLDICPTSAFPAPYQLDARKCISYLTIEHKGTIPLELREKMGNRIYGCDDCLAVCPWNKFARAAREAKLVARQDLSAPHLTELAQLDDAHFRKLFSGSPVKRTGRDRFVRNVLIAVGNSEDPTLLKVAETLLADESAQVRAMAVWASYRLSDPKVFSTLKSRYREKERDMSVLAEWDGVGQ